MTKQIPTSRGFFILIDDEDYERVCEHTWCLNQNNAYPRATIKQEAVLLHRWLVGAEPGEEVDHRNHNTLDCRRKNLRRCTKSQNMANMKIPISNTTGFKGVTFDKRVDRYTARIKVNRHHKHLGSYLTAEDAGVAYNFAALEAFGEFAYFNEIENWQSRAQPKPAKDIQLRKNNTSGYPGVYFLEKLQKWVAYVWHRRKTIIVGYFPTAEDAARERSKKRAALKD